jgi:hypothetical protein
MPPFWYYENLDCPHSLGSQFVYIPSTITSQSPPWLIERSVNYNFYSELASLIYLAIFPLWDVDGCVVISALRGRIPLATVLLFRSTVIVCNGCIEERLDGFWEHSPYAILRRGRILPRILS